MTAVVAVDLRATVLAVVRISLASVEYTMNTAARRSTATKIAPRRCRL
jgi:hypothetical protein